MPRPPSEPERKPSLAYPRLALPKAIDHLRAIAAALGSEAFSSDAAVAAMGYGGMSGSSKSAFYSLRQYRLLSKHEGEYRVSELGRRVLGRSGAKEAEREAASHPAVFKLLESRFEASELPMPEAEQYLVDEGYLPEAAKRITSVYVQTMDALAKGTAGVGPSERIEEVPRAAPIASEGRGASPPDADRSETLFKCRLVSGAEVSVNLRGKLPLTDVLRILTSWVDVAKIGGVET